MPQSVRRRYRTSILIFGLLNLVQLISAQTATPRTCPTTTAEENKALAERWVEDVVGAWDLGAVDALLADDHVHHAGYGADDIRGREGYKRYLREIWAPAFPDPETTLEQVIAEGDSVVARWTVKAAYQGGQGGTAKAGTQVAWTGISIFRFACGGIVETWVEADGVSRLRQIGAINQTD